MKYNIGEIVFPIQLDNDTVCIECSTCSCTGIVGIKNTDRYITCPDCYGDCFCDITKPHKWIIDESIVSRINKIIITNDDIRYMIDSTMISKLWKETDLFLTFQDAQTECEKRNKPK